MPDFEGGGMLDRLEAAGRAQEESEYDSVCRRVREADARRMLHDYGYPETPELVAAVAKALMDHVDWPRA